MKNRVRSDLLITSSLPARPSQQSPGGLHFNPFLWPKPPFHRGEERSCRDSRRSSLDYILQSLWLNNVRQENGKYLNDISCNDNDLKKAWKSGFSSVLWSICSLFYCLLLRLRDVVVKWEAFKGKGCMDCVALWWERWMRWEDGWAERRAGLQMWSRGRLKTDVFQDALTQYILVARVEMFAYWGSLGFLMRGNLNWALEWLTRSAMTRYWDLKIP